MSEHRIQPRMKIPPYVKRLENVNKLRFTKAIQMSDHGVKLVDHVVLLFRHKRSEIDTDRRCPLGKSLVWTG